MLKNGWDTTSAEEKNGWPGRVKLYGKNSSQIDSLVKTVWSYSEDIGMKFSIDKCAVLELENGRLLRSEGI